MKEFLLYLIQLIVDNPKDIKIEETPIGEKSFQYTITANSDDMGKIIGKEGKVIQAIRSVAKILAIKQNLQVRIEIS